MTLPASHVVDAHEMIGDGKTDLFQITLPSGGVMYLKADNDVTWRGHLYEGTAIQFDEVAQSSDGELSRPKLTMANPDGVFSGFMAQRVLENSTVVRYRVLMADIEADNNVFEQRTWKIRRCIQVNRLSIQVELRDVLDGQFFLLPARQYIPPDFPAVSL